MNIISKHLLLGRRHLNHKLLVMTTVELRAAAGLTVPLRVSVHRCVPLFFFLILQLDRHLEPLMIEGFVQSYPTIWIRVQQFRY